MSRQAGPRWNLWLPSAALLAAALMTVLAVTSARTMAERNALFLEGRLLGVAHGAETNLREQGIQSVDEVLGELLVSGSPEIIGLVLLDSEGGTVAAAGEPESSTRIRSVDLFLGRFADGGAAAPRGPASRLGVRGHGRGHFVLQLFLDPEAGALPLVARVLVPATAMLGVALVWLAMLGGRFLMRQRLAIQATAERRRLEALARAGAGLAHQLRTPLATIKGSCQLMAEQDDGSPLGSLRPRLETLITQADRMDRLLGKLLDYARPPRPEPVRVDLAEVIAEVVARYPGARAEVPATAAALVDPVHLVEILDNLVANAVAVSPEGQAVAVSAEEDRQGVCIVVSDHGPGPGNDPEHLFEPYETSRADGTGLGLPIARTLAEANGGSLVLQGSAESGCRAVLCLPGAEHDGT